MSFSDLLRRIFIIFFIIAVVLPVGATFLFLWGRILGSLGDVAGRNILDGCSFALCGLWGMSLVVLLFALTADKIINKE